MSTPSNAESPIPDNIKIIAECISDTGKIRTHNEDNFLMVPEGGLYVVADGMGGHSSGEVASQTSVDSLFEFFKKDIERWLERFNKALKSRKFRNRKWSFEEYRLHKGVEHANKSIYQKALKNALYHDMGTTIVSMLFGAEHVAISHVGDSRIYRVRGEELTQLTEDHSLVNEYIKLKILDPADSHKFPYKNVIVRALGLNKNVLVDTQRTDYQIDDTYLLCSDGLTDMVDDDLILETILRYRNNLERACMALVQLANLHGGFDNVTVMLVRVVDRDKAEAEEGLDDPGFDPDQTLELPKSSIPVAAFLPPEERQIRETEKTPDAPATEEPTDSEDPEALEAASDSAPEAESPEAESVEDAGISGWNAELMLAGERLAETLRQAEPSAEELEKSRAAYLELAAVPDGSEGVETFTALLNSVQTEEDFDSWQAICSTLKRFPADRFGTFMVDGLVSLVEERLHWGGMLLSEIANNDQLRDAFNAALGVAESDRRELLLAFIFDHETREDGWLQDLKGLLRPKMDTDGDEAGGEEAEGPAPEKDE